MATIEVFEQNGDALLFYLELTQEQQSNILPGLHSSFQLALEILQVLAKDEATAKDVSKELRIHNNTASEFLRVLTALGLTDYECLPPSTRRSASTRLYKLVKGVKIYD